MAEEIVEQILWAGSLKVLEQPGSPHYNKSSARITCVRVYHGPVGAVESLYNTTSPGQIMADIDSKLIIETVDFTNESGGIGILTINLAQEVTTFSNPGTPQPNKYEVEWAAINRKLEKHSRYLNTAIGDPTSGAMPLTFEDLTNLEAWKNETDSANRLLFRFHNPPGSTNPLITLSAQAQDIARKFLRGQDSFDTYAPIARITSTVYNPPAASNVGARGAPPGFPNLPVQKGGAAYVWLKTADRSMNTGRNRKWEQIQEWTGAQEWDSDIYPAT